VLGDVRHPGGQPVDVRRDLVNLRLHLPIVHRLLHQRRDFR
jgi:hypothetical protein